jgi:DNA repair photolyase
MLIEFEPRNESRPCYRRTARFNVVARLPFHGAAQLDDAERQVVDRIVAEVASREHRLPVFDRPTTGRRSMVREILVDQLLIPEGRGHYYLNPYCGCMVGCSFCYVQERADLARQLEGLPALPWGRYLDVKVNAAEILAAEVHRHPPGIVRFAPILTEPYQAVERHYRVTRACLEVLLGTGFAPVVLTRSAMVLEDLELLASFPRSLVGFSIPSDQDRMRLIFEPGADPIEERIEALASLHAGGLNTMAVIQPLLPMDPARVVELVAPHVDFVRIDRAYFFERVLHLYQENGLTDFCTPQYFQQTERALRQAFVRRGVRIEPMDDLRPLLAVRPG